MRARQPVLPRISNDTLANCKCIFQKPLRSMTQVRKDSKCYGFNRFSFRWSICWGGYRFCSVLFCFSVGNWMGTLVQLIYFYFMLINSWCIVIVSFTGVGMDLDIKMSLLGNIDVIHWSLIVVCWCAFGFSNGSWWYICAYLILLIIKTNRSLISHFQSNRCYSVSYHLLECACAYLLKRISFWYVFLVNKDHYCSANVNFYKVQGISFTLNAWLTSAIIKMSNYNSNLIKNWAGLSHSKEIFLTKKNTWFGFNHWFYVHIN